MAAFLVTESYHESEHWALFEVVGYEYPSVFSLVCIFDCVYD